MNFDLEQKEILDLSDKLDEIHGRSWAKYKGDVINRKVIEFLNRHIGSVHSLAVGPSVFVENLPTEFDTLIVKEDAHVISGTNTYKRKDIRLLIEVKKHGFYFRKIDGNYEIKKYFKQFSDVNLPFIYISVKESRNFIKMTKEILPENSFFLCISQGKPITGEWERFVNTVLKLSR